MTKRCSGPWTRFTEWYGKARKPHFGTVLAAARAGEPGAEAGLHSLVENALYPSIVRATALNALQAYSSEQTAKRHATRVE